MARSYRKVKEYQYLAKYYDYLLGDEDAFKYWLKYINTKKFNTVLELASGSGILANILKKQGKDVTASDISKEMKHVAKSNFNGNYLILDMTCFDLPYKYDLILSVCDSINYLQINELSKMFSCVYNHLNKGGRFIFDMHHPKRLYEFQNEYIEEGKIDNDTFYQWTINSDLLDKTLIEHFTFYTNNGMFQEQHVQHVFNINDVKDRLEKNLFKVQVIQNFIEDEKVLFIGTKYEDL